MEKPLSGQQFKNVHNLQGAVHLSLWYGHVILVSRYRVLTAVSMLHLNCTALNQSELSNFFMCIVIHLINSSGTYLRLHLGDLASIQSPAFNQVNTVLSITVVLHLGRRCQRLISFPDLAGRRAEGNIWPNPIFFFFFLYFIDFFY